MEASEQLAVKFHCEAVTLQRTLPLGGLVVNVLDFRSRGREFKPDHCCHVVCLDVKLNPLLPKSANWHTIP